MSPDEYTIRPFETIEEYRACVDLQEETWGRGFSERVPTAILKVSQILGGIAAGAFGDDGRLEGFVFGMTGLRDGEIVHWSDMLAVRPEARHAGLGTRLKAYQRERVRELGIEKMYWTFDPLRSLNAYVNFRKLGIVAREYVEDMYGTTDSPLHRGIGTDRFVALWPLESDRVKALFERVDSESLAEGASEDAAVALSSSADGDLLRPGEPDLSLSADQVLVTIPADIGDIMERDPDLARAWRVATRTTFMHYLDALYEATDILRGPRSSKYVLSRRASDSSTDHGTS